MEQVPGSRSRLRRVELCRSLAGNLCDLLTITERTPPPREAHVDYDDGDYDDSDDDSDRDAEGGAPPPLTSPQQSKGKGDAQSALTQPPVQTAESDTAYEQDVDDFNRGTGVFRSIYGDILPPSQRPAIVISGRVHPGESNASWMLKGLMQYLLSGTRKHLNCLL